MPDIYLRYDDKERLLNRSGTGNELNTESPIVRKLIIDSLLYWMKEYHIDGFRFDLAGLIDRETWDIIKEETSKINPDVVLIAEPWGGEYSPHRFSDHGWSSWNDKFRNGIKGVEPSQEKGYIFSTWANGTSRQELENFFRGTLRNHEGGLYLSSAHSVNYLESHDGYTLGDFIRLVYRPELSIEAHSRNQVVQLTPIEHQTAMFAAFCLFVSQGILMLNAGQEFARSKWIKPVNGKDEFACKPDHNSYEKDNETNWLNFKDIDQNRPLFNYYKGLIDIRKASPALYSASDDKIHFYNYSDPLHVSFLINGEDTDDLFNYFVALNAHDEYNSVFHLPFGSWELIADHQHASLKTLDIRSGEQILQPKCTMLFRKLRH
jgi:pullulanase/glycogen debranching enzyme